MIAMYGETLNKSISANSSHGVGVGYVYCRPLPVVVSSSEYSNIYSIKFNSAYYNAYRIHLSGSLHIYKDPRKYYTYCLIPVVSGHLLHPQKVGSFQFI